MAENKKILRALAGEVLETPPIWMMRQAGRYLPEYRATRAEAGDFLSLCYNSELAAEVTLQPIRRYGFDAAILFADILLLPQALGADLWFVTGEGPRLSTLTKSAEFDALKPVSAIHKTLDPVYETVRILSKELPAETTLIGFAGAPWTVATYMIAGRGTPDQAPAHALKRQDRELFERLIDLLTDATIEYLSAQIDAGAEVVKLFDSWAGSLRGDDFKHYALAPARRITQALKQRYPHVPVIVMAPRDALFEKTVSNMQEVMARGGKVLLITDSQGAAEAGDGVWQVLLMPVVDPFLAPILYALPAQLLAYHTAIAKGTDVDQPRNLAKSVTVE